jgi:hypothetical protein
VELEERLSPSVTGLGSVAAQVSASYPTGNYANWDANKILSGVKFAQGVVGINLSVKWDSLQTGATTFNWNAVDTRLQEAAAAGLKVDLALTAGPTHAPGYLLSNPKIEMISLVDTNQNDANYGQMTTGPVFWDPIFLAARESFIQAAGARYSTNPSVVAVTAGFADWTTNDWNVPHFVGMSPGGQGYIDENQQWLNAGYTTAKMLAAGEQLLDTTATAFSKQTLKLPIDVTSSRLDGTATSLASQILSYGYTRYPSQFYAQINSLSTQSPLATDSTIGNNVNAHNYLFYLLHQHATKVGLQMVSDATNASQDGYRLNGGQSGIPATILQNAVNIGLTYKPAFVEYWSVDGSNTSFGTVMGPAASSMASVVGASIPTGTKSAMMGGIPMIASSTPATSPTPANAVVSAASTSSSSTGGSHAPATPHLSSSLSSGALDNFFPLSDVLGGSLFSSPV